MTNARKPWWQHVRTTDSVLGRYWRVIFHPRRTFYICSRHWSGKPCAWHGQPPPVGWPENWAWHGSKLRISPAVHP